MTDERFDQLITRAMDELPQEYIQNLDNVAITYADEATPEQLQKQGVGHGMILLGLYEGIPQTKRGAGYMMVLPDKITLFKNTIIMAAGDDETRIYEQIKRTLWHEIAHHYGLEHSNIDALERPRV